MGEGNDAPVLRELPAVHELAAVLDAPHALAVAAARAAIEERRALILAGRTADREVADRARELLAQLERGSLRRVVNATGVIIHTNLGRAPLAEPARRAVNRIAAGYSNLELDLETGARGSRHAHVEALLRELTGAEDAIVVNNGAAAVLLATAALAGPGRAVVVSRGQLVEIGGGFRIPEVIAQSGARLVEVGTTNRTRPEDYRAAVAGCGAELGAVLRVHPSNFRSIGFVEEVSVEELCGLGVPVIDDVGSGALAGGLLALSDEPALKRSVSAGAALVCCSGDKLLGGPQAGLVLGTAEAVAAARKHPLARALRIDKLSLAALEATLMRVPRAGRARVARSRCWPCSTPPRRSSASAAPGSPRRSANRPRSSGRSAGWEAARCRCSNSRVRSWPSTSMPTRWTSRACCVRPTRRSSPGSTMAGCCWIRARWPTTRSRSWRRLFACLDDDGAADAGHRGPHRPRQDHTDPRADRSRHGPVARGARAGISIELGYASLELGAGRRLSVVDVPGHERFVRTMVAGASGIDLYLMAIAADDGVMPQTREHAAVLERWASSAESWP